MLISPAVNHKNTIESEGPSVPYKCCFVCPTVTDDSEYCVDKHIVLDLSGC